MTTTSPSSPERMREQIARIKLIVQIKEYGVEQTQNGRIPSFDFVYLNDYRTAIEARVRTEQSAT